MSEFGCTHYKTAAKILAPCCNKLYMCRLCHNEEEQHKVNISKIRFIVCSICNTKQCPSQRCTYCDIEFGKYFCLECKLYDEYKHQYHCTSCGICRIGPQYNYFHCIKCNLCLNKMLQGNHKCVENVSRDNCVICTEDLHTFRDALAVLKCGHILHSKCFQNVRRTSQYCPICRQSMQEILPISASQQSLSRANYGIPKF